MVIPRFMHQVNHSMCPAADKARRNARGYAGPRRSQPQSSLSRKNPVKSGPGRGWIPGVEPHLHSFRKAFAAYQKVYVLYLVESGTKKDGRIGGSSLRVLSSTAQRHKVADPELLRRDTRGVTKIWNSRYRRSSRRFSVCWICNRKLTVVKK